MTSPRAVLLDTCALIWWVHGNLRTSVLDLLVEAGMADGILVSPISAWEIGLLSNPGGPRTKMELLPTPQAWLSKALTKPGVREVTLSSSAALGAAFLPGTLHSDPADRLLVATARELGVPIVTGDKAILAYAAAGHVSAVTC